MRAALWFFVITFFLSGAITYGITHDATGAIMPAAVLAVVAGFIGMKLEARENQGIDNPVARVYPIEKMNAYATVQYVVTSFQGPERFHMVTDSPHFGKFVASMNFAEEISAFSAGTLPNQYPTQSRCVTLEAIFTGDSETSTSVRLRWTVQSSVNRDTCDAIINEVSSRINEGLNQASQGSQ